MRQTCKASNLNQCKVLGQNETDWVNKFLFVLIVLVVLDMIVVHVVLVMLDMAIVHGESCARTECCARCAKCGRCPWCARCTLCVNTTYGHDKSIVSIVFLVLIESNVLRVIVVFDLLVGRFLLGALCLRYTLCVNPVCIFLLIGAMISKKAQCVIFFFCTRNDEE